VKQSLKRISAGILLITTIGALDVTASKAVKNSEPAPNAVLFSAPLQYASTTSPSPAPFNLNIPGLQNIVPAAGTGLEAYLEAPVGVVSEPYVILSATANITDLSKLQLTGFVNTTEFICPGTPCKIMLQQGFFSFTFKAVSAAGNTSSDVFAKVRVDKTDQGFLVVIESISQFHGGEDACRQIWGPTDETNPVWAEFPSFANQLNTQKTLQYLVTMLILHGTVDVRDCPGGAVTSGLGWASGCGLDRAKNTMITWQNQFDGKIWQTATEIGIPPKILKTLLEIESQFYPINQRFYVDEFGLGQINQLGLDPWLRSDPVIYQSVCSAVYSASCPLPYFREPLAVQQMLRGALVRAFDASCPTCAGKLDLTKAGDSIPLIARVLKADCQQTKNVLESWGTSATYEDYWKFTLLSYHSGVGCFQDAVKAVIQDSQTMDWAHLTLHLDCTIDGERYVDGFWADLTSFEQNRYIPIQPVGTMYVPVPTATQLPPPSSHAQVDVEVYMDLNGDGIPEQPEMLTGVGVQVTSQDGRVLSAVTLKGQALFDMTGFPANTIITVTMPGLYRTYTTNLPELGIVPVVFAFQNPGLPQQLP